jgi:hypothetical protein
MGLKIQKKNYIFKEIRDYVTLSLSESKVKAVVDLQNAGKTSVQKI